MMDEKLRETKEIRLDDLIPFQLRSSQSYQGARLEQLMDSIERLGLQSPITVRPTDDGRYEIICGHNRVNAVRELGSDVILAKVYEGLSDDEALELYYDTNLNQQSFSDWNYSQRIKAIQYTETLIKKEGQQGKRSDLDEKKDTTTDGDTSVQGRHKSEETSVQSRHKSDGKSRRSTTRDRMARNMGIATATLSKYRSIIKLPEDLIEVLAQLLDEKEITFEAAYRMSGLKPRDIEWLVKHLGRSSSMKIDLAKLKDLCALSKEINKQEISRQLSHDELKNVLVPKDTKIKPILRKE